MTTVDEIVTADEAILHMPLITVGMLTNLRRKGEGPKFAVIGRRIHYRVADIATWYEAYKGKMFSKTKAVSYKRKNAVATAAPKAAKAPKARASDQLA